MNLNEPTDYTRLLSIVRSNNRKVGIINNLKHRRQQWAKRSSRGPETGHDLKDSLPYPFEPTIQSIFDNKNVLEIGPGNGRQYERLVYRTKSYCICDIVPEVLEEPVYTNVDKKFLVSDWNERLGRTFDVVHFWYVLHHVPLYEMSAFFNFCYNHLNNNGLVAFNTPERINVQGEPEGDGIGTTFSDLLIVKEACTPLEVLMSLYVGKKSTGYVMLLRKIN